MITYMLLSVQNQITIKIDTETDNLFDGEYDESVFVRQEDEPGEINFS